MSRGDEIASRIDKRLKWLEKNDNPVDPKYKTKKWYYAGCRRGGRKIMVRYVQYQGSTSMTFDEAEKYAEYLEAGGTETHYTMEHEQLKQRLDPAR